MIFCCSKIMVAILIKFPCYKANLEYISQLQKEGSMKAKSSNNLPKRQRPQRKSKIAKQIQTKLQKQYFFKAVKHQIEKQFIQDDLEFLLQHFENVIFHNRRKINQPEQSNSLLSVQDRETVNQTEMNKEDANPLKKVDANVFKEGLKKPLINPTLFNIQQNTQYFSTPKFRKRLSREIFTRKIFEKDTKSKKIYEHNRLRQLFSQKYSPFNNINNQRTSQTTSRLSKTQRTPRYKTETQQLLFQQKSIPLIISGNLFSKTSMKKHNKQLLQQKRMECFLNHPPLSQTKRYPSDH